MRIEELQSVNLKEKWISLASSEDVEIINKDPTFIRWLKYFVSLITCDGVNFYKGIQINQVAQVLFKKFKKESEENPSCRETYLVFIEKILAHSNPHSIKTHRKALEELKKKIESYRGESSEITIPEESEEGEETEETEKVHESSSNSESSSKSEERCKKEDNEQTHPNQEESQNNSWQTVLLSNLLNKKTGDGENDVDDELVASQFAQEYNSSPEDQRDTIYQKVQIHLEKIPTSNFGNKYFGCTIKYYGYNVKLNYDGSFQLPNGSSFNIEDQEKFSGVVVSNRCYVSEYFNLDDISIES